MKNKYDNSSFIALNVLLFVYFLELVFPPITVLGKGVLIQTGCLCGWFVLSFMSDAKFYFNLKIHRSFLLIFCAVTIIFPYLLGFSTFGNRYLGVMLVPLGVIVFDYYKCHGKLKDLKNVILCVMAFATVTMVITILRLIEEPYISRSIKSSGEYSEILARKGIGGYSFIYFMVPMGILMLYSFLRSKKKRIKVFFILYYFVTAYLIFLSNYTTALLVYVIASAVLIINYFSRQEGKNLLLLWISVFAVAMIILNLNKIVYNLKDVLPQRLAQAFVPKNNEGVLVTLYNEFIADRWPTIVLSFKQIMASPILGGLVSGDSVQSILNSTGQHSHIMDTYAFYGVIIGTVNIFVLLAPFKNMNGVWIKKAKALNNAMFICVLGIYFFNNATSSIALAFTIVFPLVRENFDMENQNEQNNRIDRVSSLPIKKRV